MAKQKHPQAQNPLMLRCHRLMEAFAKSDDERDFYLDSVEGFIIYVDLDKSQEELSSLEKEISTDQDRYIPIPKLTYYETKKIMECFVQEKVYDIDTKEKLQDIIQGKEARENFLEFIYDHHNELEKWQQYYLERSRVRIIEWLRSYNFHFVFEEDLDFSRKLMEKLKESLFSAKVSKDIQAARKILESKAKIYYSKEALNPRPKRGRPPKQAAKTESEGQVVVDLFTTIPSPVRPFLFTPDISGSSGVTFSSKFETEEKLLSSQKGGDTQSVLDSLNQKLATLRQLSDKWLSEQQAQQAVPLIEEPSEEDLLAIEKDPDEKPPQAIAPPKAKGKKASPKKK